MIRLFLSLSFFFLAFFFLWIISPEGLRPIEILL